MVIELIIFVFVVLATIVLKFFGIDKFIPGSGDGLTAEEATEKIKSGYFDHIVDVRTFDEWNEGHFKGAKHIPLNYLQNDVFGAMEGIDKSSKILVYCHSGNRSGQAKTLLNKAGFNNVLSLNGPHTSLKAEFVK